MTTSSRFWRLAATAWLLMVFGAARLATPQTSACDALGESGQALAREVFSALHPYDGCDDTFERCLAAQPPKPVVLRLASSICRQIGAGKDRQQIEHALTRRAQTLLGLGQRAGIELDETMCVGPEHASVSVVVYACARCPFCRVVVPALHAAVSDGPLEGKVRLCFRPFPLKDHPGSTEGGLAMIAAAKLERFWPFLLMLYERHDSFCPERLADWAREVGLPTKLFVTEIDDPANRERLVSSKREGLRNRVEETPALFVDGRRYTYDLAPPAIIDVLEEAVEAAEDRDR